MEVEVRLRTSIEFTDIEDINEVQDIIYNDMSPSEILELALNQGNAVNIDVEES